MAATIGPLLRLSRGSALKRGSFSATGLEAGRNLLTGDRGRDSKLESRRLETRQQDKRVEGNRAATAQELENICRNRDWEMK